MGEHRTVVAPVELLARFGSGKLPGKGVYAEFESVSSINQGRMSGKAFQAEGQPVQGHKR